MNSNYTKFNKSLVFGAMVMALSACSSDDDEEVVVTDPVNAAPAISSTAQTSGSAGDAYTYTVTATDADGDTLTYAATTLPSWLSFDTATATLSGTPTATDNGDHDVTITVSDGTDTTTSSFTISVTVPNTAPMVTSTSMTAATENTAYSYTLTGSDADGDTLTLSATTIPSWLSFDANSGVLSGTPAQADVGDHSVVLTISDGTDAITDTFTISVAAAGVVDLTPTTGALSIFDESTQTGWFAWDDSGTYPPVVSADDADHGQAIEFKITGSTVVGFTTREAHGATNGVIHNASSITDDGTLSFDLKMTQAPTAGTVSWFVKLETSDPSTAVEVNISTSQEGHVTPVLDVWQTYTFNLKSLADNGLDMSKVDIVLVFPQWGQGDGAMFKLDNVAFNADGAISNSNGNGATTTTALGIDFEGSQLTWESFDTANIMFESNPNTTGINASATAGLFNVAQGDGEWIGARTEGIDNFALSDSNCLVTMDVYKDTLSPVDVKFEKFNGDGWGSHGTVSATNTVVNQWEKLSFNFCSMIGLPENDDIGAFVVFPDRTGSRAQATVNYVDNITFSSGSGAVITTGPTAGAPVPMASASDVISIFSDSYTNVDGVNVNPDWGQATATSIVDVDGNNTVKMENLNYQGIEFSNQDVSSKMSLHIDYWTADADAFELFLISPGAEVNYTVTTTKDGWQSLDIPLSTYSSVVDLTNAFQFKFDAQNTGGGTIYVDNLYFSSADGSVTPPVATGPTEAAPTPTALDADVISIFSDAFTNIDGVNVNPDWGQSTATSIVSIEGNNTVKMDGLTYQGIEFPNKDVSGKTTLHIDYWTADATAFELFLISPGAETNHTITTTQGGWQSVEIPLSDFSSVVDLTNAFQFKFDAQNTGNGTIFIDNLYFY
ncbi:putative Ig domain-containing protein [Psychrosphaera sp. B3R10]|uniref:putative Ig domain-containing protein n=1 Tax=unclassified Psychrosphaera TaxID=2641570 RepID=UPI001C087CEF|nr:MULTISPECIES: putative Ig domain-containing protein [unclassified Psychrosphaera]MBU2882020.1 putative Ig domain-containing protein [Psychrosphaera sp. I2R16]MBU2989849.1 putative Ig domain-containing protein [Psychrosphaera sp. B3R10]